MIEITALAGATLIQDLGRPGLGHLGISPSGAADRGALVAGNTALGNPVAAPGLEIIGSLTILPHRDLLVAITGAAMTPSVTAVLAGQEFQIGPAAHGWRTYLTVAGGLEVPAVLGSASTDTLSGLGPAPAAEGDQLRVGAVRGPLPTVDPVPAQAPASGALVMLDAGWGPRADWVSNPEELFHQPWRVGVGDRVGTRLHGVGLQRAITAELPSEPVVTGSIQIPPDGQPVILGPDHPTTGGYPVIAVLTQAANDALAQLRQGGTVRFRGVALR
ncbi:MAG: biotin-dependent carboxyltransferase family protein [Beutenbergiaceae bacterium]